LIQWQMRTLYEWTVVKRILAFEDLRI
jgi:hypothetical protein